MKKANIKKITWKDIRKQIFKVNPDLAATIDDLDPGNDLTLYKASYPYGSLILENGIFQIPLDDGQVVPFHDPRVNEKIKSDFNYANGSIPSGITLKNSYELFINTKGHILPILITKPGSAFAFWRRIEKYPNFHPVKLFSITAGARCLFMLPNISDLGLHKNLKRDFNIRQLPPKTLLAQWEIFKTLINHPEINCNWQTELLFFSGKWLEKIKNDKTWSSLHLKLLHEVWSSCAYERNQVFYDFALSCALANRNLKPNPYLSDTLRHILMIGIGDGVGSGVGFGIATNDEAAPMEILQKIYLESYGLKKYAPTMVHPMHFNIFSKCPSIYYSLSFPTTLAFSPKARKLSSTLQDLAELKHILNIVLDEVRRGHAKMDDTILGKIATQLNFDFFHNKPDRHGEIELTNQIPNKDSLLAQEVLKFENKEFSESGTFIRGCVRISHKKQLT